MRVAGVSVGKVVKKDVDSAHPNRTVATLELEPKFAPLSQRRARDPAPEDAAGRDLRRADARQRAGAEDPGGRLAEGLAGAEDRRARRDLPGARPGDAPRVPELAAGAGQGRGRAAARTSTTRSATCRASPHDATDVLTVLDEQERRGAAAGAATPACVFGALTQNEAQLRNLITNSRDVFSATARQKEALAADLPDLPDVPRRVQGDARRLETFSKNTDPLIQRPAPGGAATSADAAATRARWRPTSSASSATSTR